MKLRTKLLLSILVPIICAVSIIIYDNYVQAQKDTLANARTNLRTSANFITENMTGIFRDIRSSIQILSDKSALQSVLRTGKAQQHDIASLQEYLRKVKVLFPFAEDIFLLDTHGNTVVSTNEKDYGKNYSDREYFINAKQGQSVVSHTLISRATNKESVFQSIPILIDDAVHGVLVVTMIVEKIVTACLQKIHLDPIAQFILVGANNITIANFHDATSHIVNFYDATSQYHLHHLPVADIFAKKSQDFFAFTSDAGIQYTGYYQKLAYNDWITVVVMADKELFATVYSTALRGGALFITCILGVVVIIIFIVSSVTTSLSRGLRFAQAVTAGDVNVHLKEHRKDELGQLYDALRTMMHTIQQGKDALHAVLEEKSHQLSATQENLIKESALNKIILNSIPDLIFCKNVDSIYTACNTACATFFNIEPHDIVGKTDMDIFALHPDKVQKFREDDQAVFASPEKSIVIEEEVFRPDGTSLILETVKTVYSDVTGNIFGLVGISRNISLRKATEKALQLATEKALEASQAKGDFLARMSHEIRTPLNAIIGMTYLLAQIARETKQREYLDKIAIAAKNLLSILNDILDYSKIEAGKLTIENAPFAVDALISEVVAMYESRSTEMGVELRVHRDNTVHTTMVGDKLRIMQVLLNLVSNALKFTHEGAIHIEVTRESEDETSQVCVFSVMDTGIGMSAAQCENVFSAFTQGDGSITRKYGGTGLGLAICKMLVELMGGEIWMTSELGVGTQCFFRLCLAKATAHDVQDNGEDGEEHIDPHAPDHNFLHKTLLLVEDNDINQEIAMEMLKMFGLCVDLAENGQQALDMCASKDYDLVLMDIQMPIMDGYTATRLLRGDPRYAHVPIIAMTANVLTADREECLNAGMNDHIPKPFNPAQFRDMLKKWLAA